MQTQEIKEKLLQHCREKIEFRLATIRQSIANVEESLLEETKISQGDDAEAGRAMLQIDREHLGKQLMEADKIAQILKKINLGQQSDYIRLGSLVYTSHFTYFISISIGAVQIDDQTYFCVALNSPIGMKLMGKNSGQTVEIQGQKMEIKSVV